MKISRYVSVSCVMGIIICPNSPVVVCNRNAIDQFLLMSVLQFFQLGLSIRSRDAFSPLFHGRGLRVFKPSFDSISLQHRAIAQWHEPDRVVGHSKVEHSNPGVASLIAGRLNDSVDSCSIVSARKEFH